MPWRISEDLKRFKTLTTGHTVLMGRKTFESLGKPLPNRRNVVLSSKHLKGVENYRSANEALRAVTSDDRVYIIGGGEVFKQFLPLVEEMYLTIIDGEYEGDAFFPEYEHLIGTEFTIVSKIDRDGYSFVDYVRKKSGSGSGK